MRLDFETILGIIFFIVFFILPAFSRGRKKMPEEEAAGPEQAPAPGRSEGAEPARNQPAPTPQATRPARSARPQGQARASTQPSSQPRPAPRSQGPLTAGSIEEALEEIRARVREAQREENERQAGGRRGSAASQPQTSTTPASSGGLAGGGSGGSLVSSQARTLSGRPVSTPRPAGGPQPRPTPPRPASLGREGVAEPLQVARRRKRAEQGAAQQRRERAGLEDGLHPASRSTARLDAPVLRTDRRALVTGMIWHEILAEPAAKRLRRTRSRHP